MMGALRAAMYVQDLNERLARLAVLSRATPVWPNPPTGFGWTRKPDPEDWKLCWYLIVVFPDHVVDSRPFDVEIDDPSEALNAALGFYR